MKQLYIMPAAMLALGACSNTNVETASKAPPSVTDIASYEYKANVVQDNVDVLPEWFTEMPEDDKAIYAVGTAITPDLQLSVDIAVMNAKSTLADRINGELRSQTKSFMSKIGTDANSSVLNEIETVTSNLIADVDVAGYRVKESEVVVNGTEYRMYVLLEYSSAEATKILMNRLKRDEYIKHVADTLVKEMEKSGTNFIMPFIEDGMPMKLSKVGQRNPYYRGGNVWWLNLNKRTYKYTTNVWGTAKQIKDKGGMVNKGESAIDVVLWKPFEVTDTYKRNTATNKKGDSYQKTAFYITFFKAVSYTHLTLPTKA